MVQSDGGDMKASEWMIGDGGYVVSGGSGGDAVVSGKMNPAQW